MNALLAKLLPWGLVVMFAGGCLLGFAKYEQAKGEARAYLQTADRLQEQHTADSTARARAQVERDSIERAVNKRIAVATVKQQLAARKADSLAVELAAQLPDTLRPQLEAIVAEHAQERALFAAREAEWAHKLALKQAEVDDARADAADLRRINESLRAATSAGGARPSFAAKALPYVLGAIIVVEGVAIVHK
jgi:hypothetical protein